MSTLMRLSFHLIILVLSMQNVPTFAVPKNYIIYMGSHLSTSPEDITDSHHALLSSISLSDYDPSKIIYSFNKYFNCFAATLQEEEARKLAMHPEVVSITESRIVKLATTHSPDFLGLHEEHEEGFHVKGSIWNISSYGDNMIIANIDSGVHSKHISFFDESLGPIPKKFKGACANEHDPMFKCNRKLIGARYFYKGMFEATKLYNMTFNDTLSPRDTEGHGSHTLSTAGGSFVSEASWNGLANGTAMGLAPKARLVAYKTQWSEGSTDMDVLAAFEAAIDDNVDIINLSMGSTIQGFLDSVAVGSFHAMKNGILTIASAGNTGPALGTVLNVYPWMLTVAASTIDREFFSNLLLGNNITIKASRYFDLQVLDSKKFYPLITGTEARVSGADINDVLHCQDGSLDANKLVGKIVVCGYNGTTSIQVITSISIKKAGGIGLIFVKDEKVGSEIFMNIPRAVSAALISYNDGQTLFSYMNSTRTPIVSFGEAITSLGIKSAPIMADFSSRGPHPQYFNSGVSKPDVTAPGVNILAATPDSLEKKENPFMLMSGTSMSSPHVSGIAALIKKIHPDWSTTAIQSSLMTTASPLDKKGMPIHDHDGVSEATPLAYGSGHIRPNLAMDPGLVYDMNEYDYLNFLCAINHNNTILEKLSKQHAYDCPRNFSALDLNYPSIYVPEFTGNTIINRKLKNVGQPSTYLPRIEAPHGVSIIVEPNTLVFSEHNQQLPFKLSLIANLNLLSSDYIFGSLVWSDAKHVVRTPIIVKPKKI
ncbi:unnamed protein product [Amaranthus hypochondriacus]